MPLPLAADGRESIRNTTKGDDGGDQDQQNRHHIGHEADAEGSFPPPQLKGLDSRCLDLSHEHKGHNSHQGSGEEAQEPVKADMIAQDNHDHSGHNRQDKGQDY